jgi:tRNA G10  N-methylase Trm11
MVHRIAYGTKNRETRRMQQFKMIYFGDYAASSNSGKRGLSVPFSGEDLHLYDAVAPLSSYTLRRLLQCETYGQLMSEAENAGAPIATFCRDRLRLTLINGASVRAPANQAHNALQATFSGGRGGTLHDWYPYLEGYSPAFVTTILKQYGSDVTRLLDPFAGAGTTPVTAVEMGLDACYAEVNPLCRAVTDAKLLALSFDDGARKIVVERLRTLSAEFRRRLRRAPLDKNLAIDHHAVFGLSEFFDADVFKLVLRARTLLDTLAFEDRDTAMFATIAVIRTLVPASRLVRRGDLRFKTSAEAERLRIDFVAEVQEALNLIASDIADLHRCHGHAHYVGDDAKALEAREMTGIDGIVTSPPYLNGTNYFRNTKIELWFLRCLRTGKDLSDFRYRAVTAGINDVTVGKVEARRGVFASEKVTHVVNRIARSAYDRRIPQMVETYFGDLFLAFRSCVPHLPVNALIAVDIGDSCYGDVHVPTDDVVAEMLNGLDCRLEDRTVLRERLSRGGQPLRQTLQIFRRRGTARRSASVEHGASHDWRVSWAAFKAQLPHQQGIMAKRNWGHGLHSLCSYQGKLKPSIAHWLVKTFVPQGGRVVDPFAGVGTVPLEAALSGRRAFAFDISPPALQITRAKLEICDAAECDAVIADLANALERFELTDALHRRAMAIRFNGPLDEYFHSDTFREVIGAREYFMRRRPETAAAALVFSCLLHILHGNRPYALSRTSHPITPFAPSGPKTYRALLSRLRDKVIRSLSQDRGPNFVTGSAYAQDATSAWPDDVHNLDAVITSPPFFDSTRFHTGNWMRLWFAGWEAPDFKTRPLDFVDERQKRSFEVYEPVFASAAERLKSHGVMVLHLGHSRKCDMAAVIRPIAERHFRFMDQFVESVMHCESHGVRDKGTVTAHQYLVLERA